MSFRLSTRCLVISLLASMIVSSANAGQPYDFVRMYIRQLVALEDIRDNATNELARSAANPATRMSDCIRNGQLYVLELRSEIAQLKQVKLAKPLDDLPSTIVGFDQQKLDQYNHMMDICSSMMAGPKPGVDYGALAAEMPKISANLDFLDHSQFELCPLVFATLIDQKPDKENHMSRLIVSTAEGKAIVRDLDLAFGKKMEQRDQDWYVSAASVLKFYLTKKGYKFSDNVQ